MNSGSEAIMELITLAGAARADGVIQRQEEILIIHAATLTARRVRSIMTPVAELQIFDTRSSLGDNLGRLAAPCRRCHPISEDGTPEGIDGALLVHELATAELLNGAGDWRTRRRPVLQVDARDSVGQTLTALLEKESPAAVVRRDGAVAGWLTLDDITETLLGIRG